MITPKKFKTHNIYRVNFAISSVPKNSAFGSCFDPKPDTYGYVIIGHSA